MRNIINLILIFCINKFINISEAKITEPSAIFFADEENIEEAFKSAILANNENQPYIQINFVPIIRYATSDDSNILQRLACDLISNGTVAIFGPSSKASSDIVGSMCSFYEIPQIRFDTAHDESTIEKLSHDMTINLYPSIIGLSKLYQDIVMELSWKTFTIIYEEDSALEKFQDVLQLYPVHHSGIRLKKIQDDETYSVLWKNIFYTTQSHKIILDCVNENLKELLQEAIEFNMTGHYKHILITNLDNHLVNIDDIKPSILGNITMLKMEFNNIYRHNKELQELKPAVIFDGIQLLIKAIYKLQKNITITEPSANCRRGGINRRSEWYSNEIGKKLINYMKSYPGAKVTDNNFITNRIEFDEFGERSNFDLDYYFPMSGFIVSATKSEEDDEEDEVVDKKKHISPSISKTRLSSDRIMLRVTTRLGAPYLEMKSDQDGENLQGNNRFKGYVADLLNKLSQSDIFPFDYSLEVVQGNQYGKKNEKTGEWDGIIRQLMDGKADMGICDLTVTQERREVVDFTVPFMSLGIGILFYNKPPPEPEMFSFLKPFSLEVWYYMATSYLIISISFFLLSRIAENEWENPHPCNPNPAELENKWCITNTTWLTMGSIMGQGCDILPRNGSMRLVNGMWYFFALMMLNSYTANLAAFLTYSNLDTEITGLNSLAEQNKIQFGTFGGGSTATFFRESNDSIYRLAWSKMVSSKPSVFTSGNPEGLERVKKSRGLYAYFIETTTLEYMVERNCDVKQVGNPIGEKHYAIALPKESPYRSSLSVSILKLSESGELFAIKKKWWKTMNNVTCEKPDTGNQNELTIPKTGGVFLLLGGGILASYIIGVSEFLWNVRQVAVEEKITTFEAFKQEATFALKFWIRKKPIRSMSRSISQSRRSSQSQAQNVNLIKT